MIVQNINIKHKHNYPTIGLLLASLQTKNKATKHFVDFYGFTTWNTLNTYLYVNKRVP